MPSRSRTNSPSEPRWLTLAEAAERANLPTRTLRDLISRGTVPAYRIGPRQIRIREDHLDRAFRRIPTVDRGGDAA